MVIKVLIYSLILITLALSAASQILSKKFQLGVKNDISTMVGMNIVNAIFGIVYFLFLCKFNIEMNITTLVFSALYALLVINSLTIGVVALSKMSILMMSVVAMAGNVCGSVVIGRIFFDEKITANGIMAVIALLSAVIIPYIGDAELKRGRTSIPVAIWCFVSNGITGTFLKFYTENENTLHSNNLFFMTNVFCLIFCAMFAIICMCISSKNQERFSFKSLGIKGVANIGARTAISNISSIISVIVIASMPISVYTIITSALGLILNTFLAKILFAEDLKLKNYIALVLAVFSVVIGAI